MTQTTPQTTPPILYDLVTAEGTSLSPWCWHVKMALAHKGVETERKALNFTQKDKVIDAGGKTFPLLVETDGQILDDSRIIIDHLEKKYPEPTLFPGGDTGMAAYQLVFRYCQTILFPTMIALIIKDVPNVLTEDDRKYFIESREQRFGMTLQEFCQNKEKRLIILERQLNPFIWAIQSNSGGNGGANGGASGFVAGKKPAMADYCLFGFLQWARVTSPCILYEKDQGKDAPLTQWMEKMLDLHNGLGRAAKACT